MRSVHLLSPELSCVCLTRTTREEKHGYNPRQTSVKTRTAQKKTGAHETICSLWLPSFCCSPSSGRCGKVSGVRVFAGSPCQMAVVKNVGRGWLGGGVVIWFWRDCRWVSFPVGAAEMMCERLSQRPGDRTKLLRERYYIPKHAPYFHTPPPRSSSSRLVKKKKKKKWSRDVLWKSA